MEVPSNKCTSSNGCDVNAFCACGTVSGEYQCICKQGYFGGGIPGKCDRKSIDKQFYRHLFGHLILLGNILHHLCGGECHK